MGTRQLLGEFIQTFRLAVPASRQYKSTRIELCNFYTLFQLGYFDGLGGRFYGQKDGELLDFQAIYCLSPAKITEQDQLTDSGWSATK